MRALLGALLLGMAGPALACGGAGDACEIDGGSYHVALPEGAASPRVIVFLHGWGSSGGNTIGSDRVTGPLLDRGYAVIAPNGADRDGPRGWNFFLRPEGRDEAAFLADVMEDATRRHGLAREGAVLGGFSIGGSMAAYVACDHPLMFDAYVPVGGNFWRPHPEGCAGPVRMLHTHGWSDGTVPLEGRWLREGFHQGDVFAALRIWREANGCRQTLADEMLWGDGTFKRRVWAGCAPGAVLEFALFDGGHVVPDGWADMAADWIEALPPRDGE